jgi:hypothetical protein
LVGGAPLPDKGLQHRDDPVKIRPDHLFLAITTIKYLGRSQIAD